MEVFVAQCHDEDGPSNSPEKGWLQAYCALFYRAYRSLPSRTTPSLTVSPAHARAELWAMADTLLAGLFLGSARAGQPAWEVRVLSRRGGSHQSWTAQRIQIPTHSYLLDIHRLDPVWLHVACSITHGQRKGTLATASNRVRQARRHLLTCCCCERALCEVISVPVAAPSACYNPLLIAPISTHKGLSRDGVQLFSRHFLLRKAGHQMSTRGATGLARQRRPKNSPLVAFAGFSSHWRTRQGHPPAP